MSAPPSLRDLISSPSASTASLAAASVSSDGAAAAGDDASPSEPESEGGSVIVDG